MSAMTHGMMSSLTDDWGTPFEVFRGLDWEFGFQLDACASADNAKCERFYSIEDDGLTQPWHPLSPVWCNPPYGKAIGRWMEKCYLESRLGSTVVALIPSRTDTAWWHDYVTKADDIRFFRGRLSFYNRGTAPFPSAIVVWRGVA